MRFSYDNYWILTICLWRSKIVSPSTDYLSRNRELIETKMRDSSGKNLFLICSFTSRMTFDFSWNRGEVLPKVLITTRVAGKITVFAEQSTPKTDKTSAMTSSPIKATTQRVNFRVKQPYQRPQTGRQKLFERVNCTKARAEARQMRKWQGASGSGE